MPSMYNSPDITSWQAQTQQGADHCRVADLETRCRAGAGRDGTCLERPFGEAVERQLEVEVGWLGPPAFVQHASQHASTSAERQSCTPVSSAALQCIQTIFSGLRYCL